MTNLSTYKRANLSTLMALVGGGGVAVVVVVVVANVDVGHRMTSLARLD